jgi:hypothetical protein
MRVDRTRLDIVDRNAPAPVLSGQPLGEHLDGSLCADRPFDGVPDCIEIASIRLGRDRLAACAFDRFNDRRGGLRAFGVLATPNETESFVAQYPKLITTRGVPVLGCS